MRVGVAGDGWRAQTKFTNFQITLFRISSSNNCASAHHFSARCRQDVPRSRRPATAAVRREWGEVAAARAGGALFADLAAAHWPMSRRLIGGEADAARAGGSLWPAHARAGSRSEDQDRRLAPVAIPRSRSSPPWPAPLAIAITTTEDRSLNVFHLRRAPAS
jgi:hypothetical protein